MVVSETVTRNLMCLVCNGTSFDFTSVTKARCKKCGHEFPIANNIPVFIDESRSIFENSDFLLQKKLFFDLSRKGRIIELISSLTPSIGWNINGKKNFKLLTDLLLSASERPRILIVGGSIVGEGMADFVENNALELVEGDVSYGPRTKIIFDAHAIPFTDESFDGVVVQAVLEHVLDPRQCVSEIYRVLKPNGIVYAETPFMQQVHGGPYDFTRYSRSGHRKLFQNFEEVKAGSIAGSATSLAWSYEYFMLALFGHSKILRLLTKFFTRFTGFWIKYLDLLTRFNKFDNDGASGFYFLGKKSGQRITDKDIINYYQ